MKIIKKSHWIAILVLGVILGVLSNQYLKIEIFKFSINNLIVGGAIIICFLVIDFVREAGLKSDKKSTHSFGLPAGTVRATLALVLIVFFVLFSLYSLQIVNSENQRLVSNILTTLATLVISAVSFYFGVKATEQGSEIASKIWEDTNKRINPNQNIDEKIILEAIKLNKDVWITKYDCSDIKLGKKKSNDVQFDLNCITFFVVKKGGQTDIGKEIPQMIDFIYNNETYSIPTDVQPASALQNPQITTINDNNPFVTLSPDAQKGLIRDFIRINASDLIKKYPEIQGITDFKKITGDTQKEYYAIQFKVAIKDLNISSANMIPKSFEFDNGTGKKYIIPTDVIEEGILDESVWHGTGENPKKLGLSVSTFNSPFTGTIGLKIFWEGKYCLMTCCHVLFKQDILSDPTATSFSGNGKEATSPSMKDKQTPNDEKIGKLLKGWYDRSLDIALAEIESGTVINQLYEKNKDVAGIRKIVSENDNGTKVKLFGRTSHDSYGKIVDFLQPVTKIKHSGRLIDDLIVCNFHSQPGDSGGLVLEESTNKIIGILVASSEIFSYVIRIQYIIDFLKIKKENNPWLI